jgi:hypothetical protein
MNIIALGEKIMLVEKEKKEQVEQPKKRSKKGGGRGGRGRMRGGKRCEKGKEVKHEERGSIEGGGSDAKYQHHYLSRIMLAICEGIKGIVS